MRRAERRRHSRSVRRRLGAVLLEALVALTILAVAGMALIAMMTQSADTANRLGESERELNEASDLLEAVALWPREELDSRLGDRAQGPWRLRISHPSRTIYAVVLVDSTSRVLLETALYRPDSATGWITVSRR